MPKESSVASAMLRFPGFHSHSSSSSSSLCGRNFVLGFCAYRVGERERVVRMPLPGPECRLNRLQMEMAMRCVSGSVLAVCVPPVVLHLRTTYPFKF